MDLNKVMFIGNLTRDPETRTLPSGATVTNFTIAVNSKRGQNEETIFLKVDTWQKTAEIAGQYLQKGSQVLVEGRLKVEEYESRDGQKRRDPVVVADRISLGPRPRGASEGQESYGRSPRQAEYDRTQDADAQQYSNEPSPSGSGGGTEDDLPF